MNEAQLTECAMKTSQDIIALRESVKSAHKRIDETDKITASIHELAKNIASMATQIKLLTERMDNSIARIEMGQKSQGERIGSIERAVTSIERNEKGLDELEARLSVIEKAPAKRWEELIKVLIGLVVGAAFALFMGNLTL